MKKLLFLFLGVCLLVPVAAGQFCWSVDLGQATGDSGILGLEFDGTYLWATGVPDFTVANLYKISLDGTLVNTYPQPPATWGSWGFRDLAWDGTYLYAGADTFNPSSITQIDPADGQPTGVVYGPFPINPCRALAYDEKEDCFWTASFTSSIYQCFKDGTYATVFNPGLPLQSAATEASDPDHPMIWWASQGPHGAEALEFDPQTGTFTGKTMDISLGGMGGAGTGSCAYGTCNGEWEFITVSSGISELAAAFCLADPVPLVTDAFFLPQPSGAVNFTLNAGPGNANEYYILLGSTSNWWPGTTWGPCPIRMNWDWFTNINLAWINSAIFMNFLGKLDGAGSGAATFNYPGGLPPGGKLHFAYGVAFPKGFVSNPVEIWY